MGGKRRQSISLTTVWCFDSMDSPLYVWLKFFIPTLKRLGAAWNVLSSISSGYHPRHCCVWPAWQKIGIVCQQGCEKRGISKTAQCCMQAAVHSCIWWRGWSRSYLLQMLNSICLQWRRISWMDILTLNFNDWWTLKSHRLSFPLSAFWGLLFWNCLIINSNVRDKLFWVLLLVPGDHTFSLQEDPAVCGIPPPERSRWWRAGVGWEG